MFRIGFVGSKGIAIKVAKQITARKEFSISGVYSRNYKNCIDFGNKFNSKPYKSFEELLASKEIDAIYIATPHVFHYQYAKKALENHVPVICEKPLTLNYDSALKLFKIAEKNNTYLVEGMWTWFNLTANKVKEWISNEIARPIKMTADFSVPTYCFGRKERLFNNHLGGGSLYDLGVYPVSYAYKLFGYPDKVVAVAKIKKDIDVKCKIKFYYNSGVECVLTSSFLSLGKCDVNIIGKNGHIRVPGPFHQARKSTLFTSDKTKFIDSEKINLFEREFLIASREIKDGLISSQYMTKEDSLNISKIMEEIKNQIGLKYKNESD